MASQTATTQKYEPYYVPDQSPLPIWASVGIFLTIYGTGSLINDATAGVENLSSLITFYAGALIFGYVLFQWFAIVIKENIEGKNSAQLKQSYVWGMFWFIFSEVMFFFAFFFALAYVRWFAVPWLAGEGKGVMTHELLWPNFENVWPLLETPIDSVTGGEGSPFPGPDKPMGWGGLPLINTVILLASSWTVHVAHGALKKDDRKTMMQWLAYTVALGFIFVGLQAYEYYEAYEHYGLTLNSGIYGTTFFLLTGFHGAHVTIGATILLIVLLRAKFRGHFKSDDHFAFEAGSWYWHFVDVVWVILFFCVYIF